MGLKIILAKTAGFCFGVKRAVEMAFKHQNTLNTYTLGPIIHNDTVINHLIQKGISPIDNLENKTVNTLIIRSHGVKPEIYEEAKSKDIQLVDATCPYVKKIHRLVQEHYTKGHRIVIVGDKTHPEVEGINGWAHNDCIIIKDVVELEALNLTQSSTKYLIVAQTTYKKESVEQVVKWFDAKNYAYQYINTICNATKERQQEAVDIAKQAECMLVIGSHYSSNTLKLYEISKAYCANSHCIADADELTREMVENCENIGITAGASTPASVIDAVTQKLLKMNQQEA